MAAGKEKVQRTAKLYDNDGHGKYIGRLLLLAAVIMAARALAPHTNIYTSNDKEKKHGAKLFFTTRGSASFTIRSCIVCFQPLTSTSFV